MYGIFRFISIARYLGNNIVGIGFGFILGLLFGQGGMESFTNVLNIWQK